MSDSSSSPEAVIIVGAGVAGLTLANALERTGIPFVVLEAHREIAPSVGASIGLLPSGLLILDQLGIYESIKSTTEPSRRTYYRDAFGKVLRDSTVWDEVGSSFGYHMVFLPRQQLLQLLYDRLHDKSRVHTDCRVETIQEGSTSVTVTTSNGAIFRGALVAGADGVRSRVRSAIAERCKATGLKTQLNNYLSARYAAVFGISCTVAAIPPGEVHFLFEEGHNFALFTGPDSVAYWFLFIDMEETFDQSHIPRFTQQDAERICEKYCKSPITEAVRFRDVYRRRIACSMVSLEEGIASIWHTDRMVLLGDSAHKMTTNSAMGGNMALESAACLANCLSRAKVETSSGSFDKLSSVLEVYQKIRFPRASNAAKQAGKLTRLQFMHDLWGKFLVKVLLPRTPSATMRRNMVSAIEGGIKIDYLDVPRRARRSPSGTVAAPLYLGYQSFTTASVFQRFLALLLVPVAIGLWQYMGSQSAL